MTKISDVEMVTDILEAFSIKRRYWLRTHRGKSTEDCPASMSRTSEALVIINALKNGVNMTYQFIGHHPGPSISSDSQSGG